MSEFSGPLTPAAYPEGQEWSDWVPFARSSNVSAARYKLDVAAGLGHLWQVIFGGKQRKPSKKYPAGGTTPLSCYEYGPSFALTNDEFWRWFNQYAAGGRMCRRGKSGHKALEMGTRPFGGKVKREPATDAVIRSAVAGTKSGTVVMNLEPPPDKDFLVDVTLTVINAPAGFVEGVPGTMISITATKVLVGGKVWGERIGQDRMKLVSK